MARVAIVSTSINARPAAYEAWATGGDLIIAGDINSPPELGEYVKELGGTYLTPGAQEYWEFSDAIGWACVQRRNAAIMTAFADGYEYIVTVDDDNVPLPNGRAWVDEHVIALGQRDIYTVIDGASNFLNTGLFCHPRFHQRGAPYGVDTSPQVHTTTVSPKIVVSQAQVVGDPDCDAVDRLVHRPTVHACTSDVVIKPGTYAAFNSQATLWHRDWAPVMACLPHIGRYDDIFASFIFARLARAYFVTAHVGRPVASSHARNEHDVVKDLIAELWGMNHVFTFCSALDDAYVSSTMPLWMAYSELIFATRRVLPTKTTAFATGWVNEWKKVVQ
jgi:hypothetical protein